MTRTNRKRSIYQAFISHIVLSFFKQLYLRRFSISRRIQYTNILIPYIYIYYIHFIIPCKFQPSYCVVQQANRQRSCVSKCEVSLRPLVFGRSIDTVRYGSIFIIDTIQRWQKVLSAGASKSTRMRIVARRKRRNASSFQQVLTKIPCSMRRVHVKTTQIPSSYSGIKSMARTCLTRKKGSSSSTKWVNIRAMGRNSSSIMDQEIEPEGHKLDWIPLQRGG